MDAIAEKLERKSSIGDIADEAADAKKTVQEWLAVLARCFQLQEAIAVLELDRVLDTSPDELDGHRLGLRAARQNRLERITRTTEGLLARMDAAAGRANTKVLLHPAKAPAIVESANHVSTCVVDFHGRLGIESNWEALDATRWAEAFGEARDKAWDAGEDGVEAAKRLGGRTLDRTKATTSKLSGRLSGLARRRSDDTGD